ncbi:glycosyltransferase family 2 protein [Hylemonella gracilis]|jgi:glycosyltransferase involved in cell wall biosynthesis|uniref:Glycosyltransferase family 2 protein n=1 Tax=Hylemonella gracilis TaxID=80880 RepID=A0A4V1A294_9BURK|nr:glycosyltransferase family 2 protein [Hylemonella gracilis]QBK05259.1 glycosyltransferase family 2 protein [Hylemonella gracilis]
MTDFKPIAVIPVYNHPQAIARMVQALLAQGLPCLLVDDGSEAGCAALLDGIYRQEAPRVTLLRLPRNQGKGAAVMAGLRAAGAAAYSHALQIDADGQHDPNDASRFLALAQAKPDAVICGVPLYDASVPKGRLYARYLTHVWVWINTLSLDIRDSMCGYRVYPLAPTLALLDTEAIGRRMDFDSEVLVRLHWRGCTIVNLSTRVRYPEHGVSHFRVWLDNALISRMHARLFFGMLWRLPRLLTRRLRGRSATRRAE